MPLRCLCWSLDVAVQDPQEGCASEVGIQSVWRSAPRTQNPPRHLLSMWIGVGVVLETSLGCFSWGRSH